MRTFEQFEAEVFSAVELKKKKAKQRKKLITGIALCLCVCLTVSVFALPILKDKGVTSDGTNDQEAPNTSDNLSSVSGSSDGDKEQDDVKKGSTENSNAAQDSNANSFAKHVNTISGPKYVVEEVYGMFFSDGFSPYGFTVFSDDKKYYFEFFNDEQTVTVRKAYSELTSEQAKRLYEIIGF